MSSRSRIGLYIILFLLIRHSHPGQAENDDEYEDEYADEEYYYTDEKGELHESSTSKTATNKTNSSLSGTTSTIQPIDPIDNNNIILELPKVEISCPEECDCSDEHKYIDCSNRNLTQVPNNIPETAVRIDLSHNLIETINADDFINCTNVRYLLLASNQIRHITKEIFISLRHLHHISLANNLIENIEPDTFVKAIQLEKLDLSQNAIKLPINDSFLNSPNLKVLFLNDCHLEILYDETFSNLTGLISLNLGKNPGLNDWEINIRAFGPLKHLQKLKLSELHQDTISELCNIISSIDVISFPTFDISCFELAAGSAFEESILRTTTTTTTIISPHKDTAPTNPEKPSTNETRIQRGRQKNNITNLSTPKTGTLQSNPKDLLNATGSINEQHDDQMGDSNNNESDTYQVAISSQTINHILIGIIIVAVVGLIIGIICRRDICGIKTKLCRTRRPPPTDQVRPAEEIPLNKV